MNSAPVMTVFALGFANALLLWGTAAASLPILIHLLNRRKFREEQWAAMRFLLAAIRKNQRRIRIEQWLLLALRTLIVLLIVFAMAKPFLESSGLPLLAGQRTHTVLALDGSLSMGYRPAADSRFETAKNLAKQMVKDARRGDSVSVVLMGSPPKEVISRPSSNLQEVAAEIETIALPHGKTDLAASFEAVARALEASEIPQKQVVFFTDLQAASWRNGQNAEALRAAIAKLEARKVRSVVIDLGKEGGENRSVADLRINRRVVVAGSSFVVEASLMNHGPSAVSNGRIRLLADGQFIDEQTIDSWPVGEEKIVAFTQTFVSPGDHALAVQIDDDPLPLDNVRQLAVPVRERVEVLLVDGDVQSENFASETDYLAEALNPSSESDQTGALVHCEVISESRLSGLDLTRYDAIALCNVAQFAEPDVDVLKAYLKQGGGVVVFGGDQAIAENYNRLLYDEGKGLLPGEIIDVVGNSKEKKQAFTFDLLGLRHPIVMPFQGASEQVIAGLAATKTWQHQRLKLSETTNAAVVLKFSDGDPAIIEAPRWRGRVIQIASSADANWTSWPLYPSYPPVMEEVMLYAAAGRFASRNVAVGQPLDWILPPSGAGMSAAVTRPDNQSNAVPIKADGDISVFHHEDTPIAGVYQVAVGSPLALEAKFAANPDPIESGLEKLNEAGLRQAVPNWPFAYVTNSAKVADDPNTVGRIGEMHRPLLWMLLVCLVLEAALAWRLGRHQS